MDGIDLGEIALNNIVYLLVTVEILISWNSRLNLILHRNYIQKL